MQYSYKLNAEDYTFYYTYNASKSERLQKRRKQTRLFALLACVPIAGIYLYQDMLLLGFGFLGVGLLWFFLLPKFDVRMYKKNFEKYVEQNHQGDFDDKLTITLNDKYCVLKSKAGEAKFGLDQIQGLEGTGTHYFVFMENGQSLAMPYDLDSADQQDLIYHLSQYLSQSGKTVLMLEDWEWK